MEKLKHFENESLRYEVTFTNVEGKKIKMKLWLSPEIAEMKLHPQKEIKNGS